MCYKEPSVCKMRRRPPSGLKRPPGGSPGPSSARGREGAHSPGWKAPRPAPAHPRRGLAGHAVIQRRHVRAAAPSLLPPPSPRAWQEKRATWSGNKGPRGPRRSGTRCHPAPGPRRPCGPRPAPRPHGPREGSPDSRLDPDSGKRDSRVPLLAGIPAPRRRDPAPPRTPRAETPAPLPPPQLSAGRPAPASAADATRQPWQRRERGPRAAAAPRPQKAAAAAAGSVLPRDQDAAPRLAPAPRPAAPSLGADSGRALLPLHRPRPAHITWFISEEMEKLMSGASMGSRRKRAGIGPSESAWRPRRGGAGAREDERSVRGGCEEGAAPPRARGDSLARSLALPRRGSRRRDCAEQLWATDLHARPGDTAAAAAARSRRTPSHVTTCAAAVAAAAAAAEASRQLPARTRRPITREHEKAPARGPAPRCRPRPPPSPSWLPSCAAQLGQGKVIPGREARCWGATRPTCRAVVAFPRLAPSPRPLGLCRNWVPPAAFTCSASPYRHNSRR
ncbi:uncharacterized protein [Vulpes vulpes]|uniref:Basic proline-rich protein-like n=1 Tax=Vulpes vulpes TaxID=9627 RepID=A0ABM4YHS1_VULVU